MNLDNAHYFSATHLHQIKDRAWHSFQLFSAEQDEAIGSYAVMVRTDEAATEDERIAIAHRKFLVVLQKWTDDIEVSLAKRAG